jgi:hypothetical protein
MTDRDDTIRDLAALVHNALHRYPSPSVRAGRVAKRIGLGEDDSAVAIETALRQALAPAGSGDDGELDGILGDVYACTRSWEAWELGTMTEEDFEEAGHSPVVDDLIAWRDAAVRRALIAAVVPLTLEKASAHIDERVAYWRAGVPAEEGVITGVGTVYVYVRYGGDQHSKATNPADLTLIPAEVAR